VLVRSAELHDDEITAIRETAANDCDIPCPHDGSDRFFFETCPMGLAQQDVFVRGRLSDYLAKRSSGSLAPKSISLYETLSANVLQRSGNAQEYGDDEEFYQLKTLCRDQLEDMFIKALSSKRFHDNWRAVEEDLLASGIAPLQAILIHTDCISYTTARDSREPGATDFNSAVRSAIIGREAEISAGPHLRDIVALLDKLVPLSYENRRGALYVEAFEALQWTAKT
jgi:hypothetical protein